MVEPFREENACAELVECTGQLHRPNEYPLRLHVAEEIAHGPAPGPSDQDA
jgi:hypothetical protein